MPQSQFKGHFIQLVAVLLGATFLRQLLKRAKLPFFPFLFVISAAISAFQTRDEQSVWDFDASMLLLILLPPIIFQAGRSYQWRTLKCHFSKVVFYMFVCNGLVFLSALAVGLLVLSPKIALLTSMSLLASSPNLFAKALFKQRLRPMISVLEGGQVLSSVGATFLFLEVNPFKEDSSRRGKYLELVILGPLVGLAFGLVMNRFVRNVVHDQVSASVLILSSMYISYFIVESGNSTGVGAICVIVLSVSSRLLRSRRRTEKAIDDISSLISRTVQTFLVVASARDTVGSLHILSFQACIGLLVASAAITSLLLLAKSIGYLLMQKYFGGERSLDQLKLCLMDCSRGTVSLVLAQYILFKQFATYREEANQLVNLASLVFLESHVVSQLLIYSLEQRLRCSTHFQVVDQVNRVRSRTVKENLETLALTLGCSGELHFAPWPRQIGGKLSHLIAPRTKLTLLEDQVPRDSLQNLLFTKDDILIEVRFLLVTKMSESLQELVLEEDVMRCLSEATRLQMECPDQPFCFTLHLKQQFLGLGIVEFANGSRLLKRLIKPLIANQLFLIYESHRVLKKLLLKLVDIAGTLPVRNDVLSQLRIQLRREIERCQTRVAEIESRFSSYLSQFDHRRNSTQLLRNVLQSTRQLHQKGLLEKHLLEQIHDEAHRQLAAIQLDSNYNIAFTDAIFNNYVFGALSDSQKVLLLSKSKRVAYKPGEQICTKAQICKRIYIVQEGMVAVLTHTYPSRFSKGAAVAWSLLVNNVSKFQLTAVSNSVLREIPIKYFRKLMHDNPQFQRDLCCRLVGQLFREEDVQWQRLVRSKVVRLAKGESSQLARGYLLAGVLVSVQAKVIKSTSSIFESPSRVPEGAYQCRDGVLFLQQSKFATGSISAEAYFNFNGD